MSENDEIVVYTFPKGKKSQVRAVLRQWGGRCLAELRTFVNVYRAEEIEGGVTYEHKWLPTPRGLAVPVEQVGELLKAARALAAEAARRAGVSRVDASDGRAHVDAGGGREIGKGHESPADGLEGKSASDDEPWNHDW